MMDVTFVFTSDDFRIFSQVRPEFQPRVGEHLEIHVDYGKTYKGLVLKIKRIFKPNQDPQLEVYMEYEP